MPKNKIIDIDAEFEGVEFDEKSINRSTARKIIAQDPKFKSKMSKVANSRNEEYEKNYRAGIERRENDLNYQEKRKEKNRKQAKDPTYLNNLKLGMEKRYAKQKGYLVCPAGIFLRQPDAAIAMGVAITTIQRRIKNFPEEYYYITETEYNNRKLFK